jgi:hypothetical protein
MGARTPRYSSIRSGHSSSIADGGRGMQLSASALQQRPVRDLLDQRVREPHLVGLTVALEQAGAHQLVRLGPGSDPTKRWSRGRSISRPRTDAAVITSWGRLEERVEPREDHLLDRRRQLDTGTHIGPRSSRGCRSRRASRDQLGEEERIAARGLDDAPEQLCGDRVTLEQQGGELVDPIVRQGRELDHLGVFGCRTRQRVGRIAVGPGRQDEQERGVASLRKE